MDHIQQLAYCFGEKFSPAEFELTNGIKTLEIIGH